MRRYWRMAAAAAMTLGVGMTTVVGSVPAGASVPVSAKGWTTIKGTWTFNPLTGRLGGNKGLFWEIDNIVGSDLTAQLVPDGCTADNLGVVNFHAIGPRYLARLSYSTAPIDGTTGHSNELVDGDVVAVHMDGAYAKVWIRDYGYNMKVHWVAYQA